ncbi:hypothetical protein GYMLUDRAFT_245829 [Collybiopsis luxurians FD-317 M1]|uniref:Uncharacterized protein n=1 Tax=Collybiopsis luxurians FD-317 M1 TaxID=944289 RepID=A0A0D0BTJ2_9AGAR|nr:hypothetical protein GYMLUDRAFT_245829 [Collybiopsis luxurians FD-317 M1]
MEPSETNHINAEATESKPWDRKLRRSAAPCTNNTQSKTHTAEKHSLSHRSSTFAPPILDTIDQPQLNNLSSNAGIFTREIDRTLPSVIGDGSVSTFRHRLWACFMRRFDLYNWASDFTSLADSVFPDDPTPPTILSNVQRATIPSKSSSASHQVRPITAKIEQETFCFDNGSLKWQSTSFMEVKLQEWDWEAEKDGGGK